MGILDTLLTSPGFAAGAGLLAAGEANQSTGAGLLTGLNQFQRTSNFNAQQAGAQLRQQALQQAIEANKRREASRKRISKIVGQQEETEPFEADTFPGEPVLGGLETITQEGSGVLGGQTPLDEGLVKIALQSEDPNTAIGLLNALKADQAKTVTAASTTGKIMQDFSNGFLNENQAENAIEKANQQPVGSQKLTKMVIDGEARVVLVDNDGNVNDLGKAVPGTPLIDLGGLTKAQVGRQVLNREHLKFGRTLIQDITSQISSGAEPAGVTRSVVGGIQGAIDQLTTAADEVTGGATSRGLRSVADGMKDFSKIFKKDLKDGRITQQQAKDLGFVDSNIAVTDLKRGILSYMVARLNVGSGQKITNQMISEAREQTKLGGFGAGGKEIALARFQALGGLFDSRISALDQIIEGSDGKSEDISSQLKALQEALGE